MKLLTSALLVFAISSCASAYTKGKTYRLTILHTNDHHGHFFPNKDGEYGLAARATLIKQIRDEVRKDGGHVLLLDAGDANTGTPQSDMLDAEPDFKGMGKLGYDAMAIGNHEFDNSLATIFKQRTWAGFPFLSANIYYKNTSRRVFPSHIEKKFDGLKVTIFGLTTEDTPIKSNPIYNKGLRFTPVVDEAKKIVPHLKKETDVLIAVTHAGHYVDGDHGANAPGDVEISRAVKGIDLIVGGHTHAALFSADNQNGTIIVQAGDWGKYLGRVDLEIVDGKVTLKEYKLIPINLLSSAGKIAQDPSMAEFLTPFKTRGDAALQMELGTSEVELVGDRFVVRFQETNLGNLIAEAYRQKFKADFAITNSGGVRATIPAGKITLESLMTVLPFGNEVGVAKMTGAEIEKFFTYVIHTLAPKPGDTVAGGAYPQLANIEMTANRSQKTISNIRIGGEPIEANKTYTVAVPKFVAADGGDGFPKMPNFTDYGFIDANIVKDFILEKKTIKAEDFAVTGKIKYE
ncbi:MAG: bifunctional UDP-sugar hydrolase/5'-nucleotidase [Bacteriovoracaceae bacterium]